MDIDTVYNKIYNEFKNGKCPSVATFYMEDQVLAEIAFSPTGKVYIHQPIDSDDEKYYDANKKLWNYVIENDYHVITSNDEYCTLWIVFDTDNMKKEYALRNALRLQYLILQWCGINMEDCNIDLF